MLGALAVVGGCILLLPAGLFFAQVVLGTRQGSRAVPPAPAAATSRPRVGILIPAHNEEQTLGGILDDLKGQCPADSVLVVADNCTDGTAALARNYGVRVSERTDQQQRGKGYALAHGVRLWADGPPDVLIFLDADCRIGPDFIARLLAAVTASGRPAQAQYLMRPHADGVSGQLIGAFAWYLINSVRQRGLAALGAPARLNGTGMAIPWPAVAQLPLASAHLAEDTLMGLDLALRGAPAVFVADATVTSTFPATQHAEVTQRQRWEAGQADLLITRMPGLLLAGARRRAPGLVVGALDLCIPPLTRFALVLGAATVLGAVLALFGAGAGLLILAFGALALTGIATLIAYADYRRASPDAPSLQDLAAFIGLKLKVLRAGRATGWVRTGRDHERGPDGGASGGR